MSAERKPHADTTVLARCLVELTRLSIRYPRVVVIAAAVGLVLSIFLSSTRLGYRTDRASLIDHSSDFNRRWLRYTEEFGDKEDVVVVVEGDRREAIIPVLDELVESIDREDRYFQASLHEIDLSKLRSKGLHFLSLPQLLQLEGFLGEVEPIVRGGWGWLSPGTLAAGMVAKLQSLPPEQKPQAMAATEEKLARLTQSFLATLDRRGYMSPWPDAVPEEFRKLDAQSRRLISENGKLGFILLKFKDDSDQTSFIRNTEAVDAMRQVIAQARARFPGVEIGLTGLPVMENDEMRCSQSSMTLATVLSFGGVVVVLVAGFGGFRHMCLAMVAAMVGMVWSLGYTTLAVGHLNILSSAFGAILVGVGSDYSVYYVARYMQLRSERLSTSDALLATAASVAPGITVGAATSAIAFFMAGFTEFTGVAELGIISGGGIVLCWLAAMTLLPAFLQLSDARRQERTLPTPLDFHLWILPLGRRPGLVLGLAVAATVVVAVGIGRLTYDHNLLNMQPVGLESVALEHKLLAETKDSAYYALSIADSPQEALARRDRLLQLPTVEKVEEIVSQFPAEDPQKTAVIDRLRRRLADLPQQAPQIPVAAPQELGHMLQVAQSFMDQTPHAAAFQQQLEKIGGLLSRLPQAEYYSRLSEYQQRMAGDLLARLRMLQAAANPEPPQLSDLPAGLVTRFVGGHGRHLLRIYANRDIWDIDFLRQFVSEVRSIDPEATGNPLQIYEAAGQMKRSFEQTTWYALAVILPVVFFNFGNIRCTLLAILPLVLGTSQMFGLMGFLGLPCNPANMIALPLMLGMGMDNGVHIVHDYLSQSGRYRMSAATGVAVVLNTLTTMVGFAVLVLADHRGLQSLGRVLTIGMTCCLFCSVVILPTLLAWMSRNREGLSTAAADVADGSPVDALEPSEPLYHRVDGAHPSETGRYLKPHRIPPRPGSLRDEHPALADQ